MDYNYEFVTVQPKKLFVTVKYTKDGYPDVVRKLGINEFTKESLERTAEAGAYEAVSMWAAIDEAPDVIEVADGPIAATYEAPPNEVPQIEEVYNECPEYDITTHAMEWVPNHVTEYRLEWDAKITELSPEEAVEALAGFTFAMRMERDMKLATTDHWMLEDTAPITQAQLDYRQALRNVTDQPGFPKNIVWPTPPAES